MRTFYHPALILGYYLNSLPEDLLQQIPKSTRADWQHKINSNQFGYEWFAANRQLFSNIQQIQEHRQQAAANKLLLKIIALTRFIEKYRGSLKERRVKVQQAVLYSICKISLQFGLMKTLKWVQLPYSFYLNLKNSSRCIQSPLQLCYTKHPAQLLINEVRLIKEYATRGDLLHWPLNAIFHLLRRDKKAFLNLSTFYKYAALLNLKRRIPASRRKNHCTGISALKPLQILHADITGFKCKDNSKACIYFIQDNFSRMILKHSVSLERKAAIVLENINAVVNDYLKPNNILQCELVTDDGAENHIKHENRFSNDSSITIKQLIAQQDIEFSNSMIEAANKQIKYHFLYHKQVDCFNSLVKYVAEAVEDFNNRPHNVLKGLTPLEVLNGRLPAGVNFKQEIKTAKQNRLIENRKLKCCYSF